MRMTRFFRRLGFNQPKPRTRIGRWFRRSGRTLAVLVLLYVGLQAFPQVLFPYSYWMQGITLYALHPFPSETAERIAAIVKLVDRAELAVAGRSERIFVCNQPWLFRLFSPMSAGAFAYSLPVTDNIFLANADFVRNVARSAAPEFNTRSFSAVAAHRVGFLHSLPTWVVEGYCDYVAHESSFPEAKGLQLLATGKQDPSGSFQYFIYRQMVRYLIEDRQFSFNRLSIVLTKLLL
jgi:hypothetical protein